MEETKVYFTSFKTSEHENLIQKLHRLMKQAGFESIDFNEKYATIKIHFGEYGNLAFLRPNYAKVVADYVKELGGKAFLTDCNTLYVGSRKNALDHLDTAYVNGFSPLQIGCHVLIGDGLKGTDETIVPIDGEYVKEAKIGHAIMDADVFISLTHFKGHETAGFECMLSCLPSVTSVEMASLLPHKEMQVDGSLNVTVGVSFLLALLFRTCGVLLCIHYIFLRTDCIILKNIACS